MTHNSWGGPLVCLLGSGVLFFLVCREVKSGYSCNNDCRSRYYFYNDGLGIVIEYGYKDCLACTAYRCADYDGPDLGSCQDAMFKQKWRTVVGFPLCSYSSKETVEATIMFGGEYGDFKEIDSNVYQCQQ